jgi:hypothetical protein
MVIPAGLVRGELPAVVYVQKVRAHGCGPRSGPVSEEHLWALVEHPDLRPSTRVGAVIALERLWLLGSDRLSDALDEASVATALALEAAAAGLDAFLVADALDRAERAWRRASLRPA